MRALRVWQERGRAGGSGPSPPRLASPRPRPAFAVLAAAVGHLISSGARRRPVGDESGQQRCVIGTPRLGRASTPLPSSSTCPVQRGGQPPSARAAPRQPHGLERVEKRHP